MGQQSTLHAIKISKKVTSAPTSPNTSSSIIEENEEQGYKPLCETLRDSSFSNEESFIGSRS